MRVVGSAGVAFLEPSGQTLSDYKSTPSGVLDPTLHPLAPTLGNTSTCAQRGRHKDIYYRVVHNSKKLREMHKDRRWCIYSMQ